MAKSDSNSIHHGPWLVAQSEGHSPGKRKVPGSNPGRSLGHFFRSVISHSSLSFFQKKKSQTVHGVCTVGGEMLATVKVSIN